MPTLADRLMSFVVERYPFALPAVRRAIESCDLARAADQKSLEELRPLFCAELMARLGHISADQIPDTTPGVTASSRMQAARNELTTACDGFLIREAIAASLTPDERREILRGM